MNEKQLDIFGNEHNVQPMDKNQINDLIRQINEN